MSAAADLRPRGLVPAAAEPATPKPDTATAFLLAPGIAALAGGVPVLMLAIAGPRASVGLAVLLFVIVVVAFALVGYVTALVLAMPIYLLLPDRARGAFAVVVPLAGAIAAAPWLAVAQPWRGRLADSAGLAIPFALGCVAGVAFWVIRHPRAPAGPNRVGEGSPSAADALSCGP